jgi:tetraacyldisaccharide 4'-kinase
MTRRAPDFWWRRETSAAALALSPVARIWGAVAAWRMAQPPRYRAPIPVVCVGNPTVGGAGKTPTVIALARMARGRGLKPGLLASGYGGSAAGPVVVDAAVHTAAEVGDEALLLSAVAPTVVARDRAEGARQLVAEGVDIVIMDDGFQNPAVAFDLSLLAVDAAVGTGNGRTVPSGPMRAPLIPQLRRCGALLVIGEGAAADPLVRAAARAGRATVRARLRPTRVKEWRKDPILAFAGIGHPEKFFASLAETHAPVARRLSFPDHYAYSEIDARKLLAMADAEKLRLVTTEKDFARLAGAGGLLGKLRERAEPFHVFLEFENPTAIGEMIDEAVRKAALAQTA